MAKPTAPLPPEVLAAFEQRQPLQAIRLLLASRAGAVQKARRQPGPSVSTTGAPKPENHESVTPADGLSPGEVPSSSASFWGWVVVALFVYLVYRLLQG